MSRNPFRLFLTISMVFVALLLSFCVIASPTATIWHQDISNNNFGEGSRSSRPLTIIKSRGAGLRWMMTIGGSREDMRMFQFPPFQFKPKSVQMDFTNSQIPIPIVLYDQIPNLNAVLSLNNIDYLRLKRKVSDRARIGQILIEACASETPEGDLMINTVWSENSQLKSDVLLVTDGNDLEGKREVDQRLLEGYLPVNTCGFKKGNASQYLIVFVRPHNLDEVQVPKPLARVKIGQSFDDCLQQDRVLSRQMMTAQRLHVHVNQEGQLRCAAIYLPKTTAPYSIPDHFINKGSDLDELYAEARSKRKEFELVPKSVSRIIEGGGEEKFVVLWAREAPIWSLPPPVPLRMPGYPIPFQYLPGLETELSQQVLTFVNQLVMEFMRRFDIPGISIAIVKNEHLKLAVGFGYADLQTGEQITPNNRFRLASISKIVTATSIGLLIDGGNLTLDDRVFGEDSIFGYDFATNGEYHPFVEQITIKHLLTHTVGSWSNMEDDPVFRSDRSKQTEELIRETLHKCPPKEEPGKRFLYSNFGYLLLGQVIKQVSGLSYADFVNERLFEPSGLTEQSLLTTELSDISIGEVLYYPTAEMGDDPYELPNASNLAACCGWLMKPVDMLRFLVHADGFTSKQDLISPEMFTRLGIPTKESNYTYAMGWSVNERGFNGRIQHARKNIKMKITNPSGSISISSIHFSQDGQWRRNNHSDE